MIDQFMRWLSKSIPEVPEEISVCEFDCRETECMMENWETCPRRLEGISQKKENREH
jgi:hypothetical protein